MYLAHTLRIPFLLLVASTLASSGLVFPVVWYVAPIGLGLFFYVLLEARSWKRACVYGLMFGSIAGGSAISWFWDTLPLTWLKLASPSYAWWLVAISWGSVALVFGVVTACFAPVFRRALTIPYLNVIANALLFAVYEEARMWAFSLWTYAPRSLLGAHFSPAAFGYPLTENTFLLQVAEGGGLWYLNILVALGAGVIALGIRFFYKKIELPQLSLGAALILIILIYPLFSPYRENTPHDSVRLALVVSDIPINHPPNDPAAYLTLLKRIASSTPSVDIIALPEEDQLESAFPDEQTKKAEMQKIFGDRKVLIMGPRHTKAADEGNNVGLVFESEDGTVLARYAKRFMMPNGEYIPYTGYLAFSLRKDQGLDRYYTYVPDAKATSTPLAVVDFKSYRIGGLICSDILSPQLYRELGRDYGANVLVNIANHSWFHHSEILKNKLLQIAKVHAVQNRAYFFQAANGAPSYAIDPRGNIIGISPVRAKGVLFVDIPSHTSEYQSFIPVP